SRPRPRRLVIRARGAVPRRALRGSGVTDPPAALAKIAVIVDVRQGNTRAAGESIANHARRQTLRAFRGRRAKEGFPSHGASLPIVHPLTLLLRPISASDSSPLSRR